MNQNRTDYLGTLYKAHCLGRHHIIGQGVLAGDVGAALLVHLNGRCSDQEGTLMTITSLLSWTDRPLRGKIRRNKQVHHPTLCSSRLLIPLACDGPPSRVSKLPPRLQRPPARVHPKSPACDHQRIHGCQVSLTLVNLDLAEEKWRPKVGHLMKWT
jgi:hypothetical protein